MNWALFFDWKLIVIFAVFGWAAMRLGMAIQKHRDFVKLEQVRSIWARRLRDVRREHASAMWLMMGRRSPQPR